MTHGKSSGAPIERRNFLAGAGIASIVAAVPVTVAASSSAQATSTGAKPTTVKAGAGHAQVTTTAGVIEGYQLNEIYAFKGIPYGQSTAGAGRFKPPKPPTPWSGVRSCRSFGLVAPQDKGTGRLNDEEAFIFQWNDSVEGEDCLRVNVWTPGLNDGAKRPVMVWLHGGGFEAGSGNDLPAFDGHNLAQRGDVVVVTLNHRLNLLGFLDLSAYGPQYAHSSNVGMLDIVTALEWVRDNIARFGGDPGCVTIFGQSGGGAKVGTLMGMPAAQGLFHRAIVQSGSFASGRSQEQARQLAGLLLAELGIPPGEISRIETVPYLQLRQASEAVIARGNRNAGGAFDPGALATRLGYSPVVDGDVLPASPFVSDAPSFSANVPLMVGTTLNEFASGINHPEYEQMTEAELLARVEASYPGRGATIVSTFKRRTPGDKPFDLWSRIASAPIRQAAINQALAKARQGSAPAYLYWFTRFPTVLDGRPRAFHCAEIPYVFANAEKCAAMTGGGTKAKALGDVMTDAWVAFARNGNPNHANMPRWDAVGRETPTMIFDDEVTQAVGLDQEELASVRR